MNIEIEPNALIDALLQKFGESGLCILDSCGAGHTGSHMLYAGVCPYETLAITNADPQDTLDVFDEILAGDRAAIFTICYDFGRELEGVGSAAEKTEPDLFVSTFDSLLVGDYHA